MLCILRIIAFISFLVVSPVDSTPPTGGGWFGFNKGPESRKWQSMLDVDPAKIISILMKHGGLLIPESSKDELEVLAKVCKADRVRLNVMGRELEVKNFVVQLPGEEEALRIGRVYLHWDSYLKPCVEVAVDDVSLLFEFVNVLLTETNWDELKKNGFPPELPDEQPVRSKKSGNKQTELSSSSFVRIGSIDLSGNIVAILKSRPLKKDLAQVQFSLDTFDPLDEQIQEQALENLASTGRRGCTTDELYSLIQRFVIGILKNSLLEAFDNVAIEGPQMPKVVGKVVTLTKKSVSNYINEAGEWSGKELQERLSKGLRQWGLTETTFRANNRFDSREPLESRLNP